MMRVVRAPGRVNLIGEHTDHSGGFVMPAAIQLATSVAITPRTDRHLVIQSDTIGETATLDLEDPLRPTHRWHDYVAGVASVLAQEGCRIDGANLLITSTLPSGAGLSSSAALEVAVAYALVTEAGRTIDRVTLARWCQRAENEFVGARCGIMDQYVACMGHPGHALLIDCRSLNHRLLPIPDDVSIVVCNTMVRHAIAASEYNARRADCEAALQAIRLKMPDVNALRDVTLDDLKRDGCALPPTALKRARHVISENARVLEAADALERFDLATFGELMAASHRSLRDDYQVSCDELDLMVELASSEPEVIGTRMTGGGFGGCTVSLVQSPAAGQFLTSMQQRYEQVTGIHPDGWICMPSGGVEELDVAG